MTLWQHHERDTLTDDHTAESPRRHRSPAHTSLSRCLLVIGSEVVVSAGQRRRATCDNTQHSPVVFGSPKEVEVEGKITLADAPGFCKRAAGPVGMAHHDLVDDQQRRWRRAVHAVQVSHNPRRRVIDAYTVCCEEAAMSQTRVSDLSQKSLLHLPGLLRDVVHRGDHGEV
ncbi:hypothetical protein C8Q77DRAFT_54618 [Trametes polyzona]|nr:hypothetical protein C8Q77DRAFT_54618 [Trametes polyzona]